MADGTGIEWADSTWQPITGCSVVSPGCTNCYAMRLAGTRLRNHPSRRGLTRDSKAGPVWNGTVWFNEQWLDQPLRWRRPRRIFVCAHGDLFAEAVPDEWIDRVFAVMALAPQHTFLVLTKRAARMRAYFDGCTMPPVDLPLREPWRTQWRRRDQVARAIGEIATGRFSDLTGKVRQLPLPNVMLGVSVEDQARADERIPDLLATPAAKRFISAEPLLGPVDLTRVGYHKRPIEDRPSPRGDGVQEFWIDALCGTTTTWEPFRRGGWGGLAPAKLDWVIVGGESGAGARPINIEWASSLIAQCRSAGVACFVKQLGGRPYWQEDATASLPLKNKKGGDWSEWPEALRVREFPT